ncbi:mechanosensitive ion channel protein MscS [Flavobacterium album]|uniref:Mechanosensitive ion channel protein MscS n=1 Tax=Flavobacterium album TaxID=2175091 RepID=A0A2S1R1N7_9FLAO|nr:mechanosensitive ion channel family protein [Flavobacterium album]AWH86554.1 mechanosensitive ion channel protein MscS [Flavobacterium album]
MNDLFNATFLGNPAKDWFIVTGIITGLMILLKVVKLLVIRRIKKWASGTSTSWDDFIIKMIERNVLPILYVAAFYFPLMSLDFSASAANILQVAFLIVLTFFILRTISATFKKFIFTFISREEDSETKEKQAAGLIVVANIIIWVLGIIFLIDNLGYNVTTLIAGLGVGGIAIALAAQAVLGDLFSYFVIFFDRPFEIGDFVTLDSEAGVIEYIGIKTTRIRTLSGEQLICSNTDLTNSRLHNYKRMEKRRVVFKLGVTYQTPQEQLRLIPEIVKSIIEATPEVQLDRGHFSAFNDSSLDFEFVYYVLSPDYTIYMDRQQKIYLDIVAKFEAEHIDFAYPTRTLFIAQ